MLLSRAMRKEFSASKVTWAAIIALQVAALLVAGASIWFEKRWSAVALFVGIAVPVVTAGLKRYAGTRYDLGERLRRLLVRADGLGKPVDDAERLLATVAGTVLPTWDPDPIGSYYSSPKRPGPPRLAHIVAQSAFFTAAHARTTRRFCWALVTGGMAAGVALLLAVLQATNLSAGLGAKVAQAASSLIAFGFASEFYQLAAGYADLEAAACRTLEDCCRLSKQDAPTSDAVMLAVSAYDQALAKAPPIPGLVYRVQRRGLEEAWSATEASASPAMPTA